MSTNFEFNAPQYINFSDMDDPKADKFFDISLTQDGRTNEVTSTKLKLTSDYRDLESENKDPNCPLIKGGNISSCKKTFPVLKKVLHEIVNQQIQNDKKIEPLIKDQGKDLIHHFEKLELSERKPRRSKIPVKATELFNVLPNKGSARKSHHMITRLDAMNLRAEMKSPNCEIKSEEPKPTSVNQVGSTTSNISQKSTPMKRNASPLHSAKKFISLAEQVEHFYKDTPERYRFKPNKPRTPNFPWGAKPKCVPKTPNLTTKYRARKVNFPDKQQREEMELEEIKKHQIKANPLNEKILQGPCLNLKAPIIKKPVTVPQPFSLTEVKKKTKEASQEPVFQFKAQPVPTTILNGPVGIPVRKIITPTKPKTPQIHCPSRIRVEVKTPDVPSHCNTNSLQKTKLEPFSFDARMKEILQKKEEFIKKVIEEEKKNFNSFKAHPMPSFKSKNDQSIKKVVQKTIPQPFNLTQVKGTKANSEDNIIDTVKITPFKAKPADVVHQKPFVPKLEKHETILPADFHLNTEKRAAERQKFDEKIKQKEEKNAVIMKLLKEEEEKMERAKMLEDRKKAEFKARPLPHYKVFEIQASGIEKMTFPQSPKLSTKFRVGKKPISQTSLESAILWRQQK